MESNLIYEFVNNYNDQILNKFYKFNRNNILKPSLFFMLIGLVFIFIGVMMTLDTVIYSGIFICILSLIIFLCIISLRNNYKSLIDRGLNRSKLYVKIFDDHLFIHHICLDSESRENITWDKFYEFKEFEDCFILTIKSVGSYFINRSDLNNLEMEEYIKTKMRQSVRIYNGKINKPNKEKRGKIER